MKDSEGRDTTLADLLDETYTDGFLVLKDGAIAYERYFNGMTERTLHLSQSVAKSVTGAVAGILVGRGLLDPAAPVTTYLPELEATGWKGERVSSGTHEYVNGVRVSEQAEFRAYASPAESFADYVRMLKNNPRYQKALQSGGDVKRFAQALQSAGYATDPAYAAKISAIAHGPTIGRAVDAIAAVAARTGHGVATAGGVLASAASAAGGAIRR